MPLRATPERIASEFALITLPDPRTETAKYQSIIKTFLDTWFYPAGSDLEPYFPSAIQWDPPPWHHHDGEIMKWADYLYDTWRKLCFKSSDHVKSHPTYHSLLPIRHPFILPGSRFRESYYWDSYWIILGLLTSNLQSLAKGMVSNFVDAVHQHNKVPNGFRSYYSNRSQPPFLAIMVNEIFKSTGDADFVKHALPALIKEHRYWMTGPRYIKVRRDRLSDTNASDVAIYCHSLSDSSGMGVSRYYAEWDKPRPESYKEDIETVKEQSANVHQYTADDDYRTESSATARMAYRHIATAAESGWDFSSRWLSDANDLATIRTTCIIPIDLNAILYKVERCISEMARYVNDAEVASRFACYADDRMRAINEIFWDESQNKWRDLFIINNDDMSHLDEGIGFANVNATPKQYHVRFAEQTASSKMIAYASEWIPLWCGCAPEDSHQARDTIASLVGSGLLQPCGVAASTYQSGQQWDWPNAWPPLQHMIAEGCAVYGGEEGKKVSDGIKKAFLMTTCAGWKLTGKMFEKYHVLREGGPGGGGEYECVEGFGWTNGLALHWLFDSS